MVKSDQSGREGSAASSAGTRGVATRAALNSWRAALAGESRFTKATSDCVEGVQLGHTCGSPSTTGTGRCSPTSGRLGVEWEAAAVGGAPTLGEHLPQTLDLVPKKAVRGVAVVHGLLVLQVPAGVSARHADELVDHLVEGHHEGEE